MPQCGKIPSRSAPKVHGCELNAPSTKGYIVVTMRTRFPSPPAHTPVIIIPFLRLQRTPRSPVCVDSLQSTSTRGPPHIHSSMYLPQIGRTEEKPGVEVHRQVRARLRRAVKHIHAVMQNAREVGVDVRIGVKEEQGAWGGAREVARVKGGHGPAGPKPHQMVRPLRIKLPWLRHENVVVSGVAGVGGGGGGG